jgi:hypothetical protein
MFIFIFTLLSHVLDRFVLEALTLTFMTTPLVTFLYPPDKRVRAAGVGANFNNVADTERDGREQRALRDGARTRFTFVLDKLEHLPGMMAMAQLIQPPTPVSSVAQEDRRRSKSSSLVPSEVLSIEALRLIELSDRVSAVMKSSASESLLLSDPLLAIFRMFGQLHDLRISTALSIVTFDDLAYSVTEHARNNNSDMIILPWLPNASGTDPTLVPHEHDMPPATPGKHAAQSNNPFDALFKTSGAHDKSASALHAQFVRGVFSRARTDVALFVDQEESVAARVTGSKQHLFMIFFGGPDDRLALEFVVQLCTSPNVTATVLRLVKKEVDAPLAQVTSARLAGSEKTEEANALTVTSVSPSRVFPPLVV